jgi:hypothetical protein
LGDVHPLISVAIVGAKNLVLLRHPRGSRDQSESRHHKNIPQNYSAPHRPFSFRRQTKNREPTTAFPDAAFKCNANQPYAKREQFGTRKQALGNTVQHIVLANRVNTYGLVTTISFSCVTFFCWAVCRHKL